MTEDFLGNIKAGHYIKVRYRDDKPHVQKVTKVTRTQIVISEWGWGDEPQISRFRISSGVRLGDSWLYQTRIVSEPVSPEESAAYEARMEEAEKMRKERKRLNAIEVWAKEKLCALFGGRISPENIKIQFSSNDGMKTGFFEIKCEKVSEEVLVSTLERVEQARLEEIEAEREGGDKAASGYPEPGSHPSFA